MPTKKTKVVQVVKNENNPKKLFQKWNKYHKTNVKCAEVHCSNDVDSHAYIVVATSNQNKQLIAPLCKSCYESESNSINYTTSTFIDYGSTITVEQDLLIEYNN